MGFHFDTFVSEPDAQADARRDMWGWAEPVIVDRAALAYEVLLADPVAGLLMARKHRRLWRTLLQDDHAAVTIVRGELYRTARNLRLEAQAVEAVDEAILDELMDIVLCRFRASRTETKTFTLLLVAANSALTAARAAA